MRMSFAATAALVALDRLWELQTPDADLLAIAAGLGSDVPFALVGGTAQGTGSALGGLIAGHYGDKYGRKPPLVAAMRDVLAREIPMILRTEIYATACIIGGIVHATAFYTFHMPLQQAMMLGMIITLAIRLAAIRWHLKLPAFILER